MLEFKLSLPLLKLYFFHILSGNIMPDSQTQTNIKCHIIPVQTL